MDQDDIDPNCPECDGNGYVADVCGVCHGSGEGSTQHTSCYSCKGHGEIGRSCPTCEEAARKHHETSGVESDLF